MKGGIMIALGGKKDGDESDPARDYAKEAFSAVKDDDEAGFVEAFVSAVRACKSKKTDEDEG